MQYSTHLLRHLRFTIGQNIRHLRTSKNMALYELAWFSNVSERLLARYELGKNEIRLDELLKIACVLGVKMKELLSEDNRETICLYLNPEVLDYFKSTGDGWQSRINNFLKAAVTNLIA